MSYKVDWVDAFTDRPFGGNGCAVVHDAGALDDATCMAFVRETSLVECTFTEHSDVADLKVRYFLASREIPFAGHPTIATVAACLHRGVLTGDCSLETGAGLVAITVADGWITMMQVAPTFGAEVPAARVAALVGLQPGDIVGQPQFTSTGLPFCITLVRSLEALRRAGLRPDEAPAYARDFAGGAADMCEPYLVTLDGTGRGDTFSRLLMLPPSPPEDPFTGSATGAAAAYLWHHGLIDTPRYTAAQGHDLGRPGTARVEVLGPPDAITGVRVTGQGHVLMSGDLHL
ncbi:phenazine biosynthesis protein PhzF [Pseudaestuariivita atlantica]|uniref:Phenazine biosynthesis protein PhzF n=2 Tax=Pseudaestuariivita atlantica TaxID=1317121 RepID=A0A0L1JRR0_9RHOB|nr:PhzF family phenazine biosynthesis protein [Pseudaestuariivita atlantica]KNG94469.1 phenazine biosynthesis protein PhzF [Pseudaestuariivita atlantica]